MAKGESSGRRRSLGWIATLLVLALIAGGAVAWRLGYVDDLIDRFDGEPDGPPDPAQVAPPDTVDAPEVVVPPAPASPADGRARLDQNAVAAAIDRYLGNRNLGRHVLAAVAPLAGGGPGYTIGDGTATPASTTKIVTSAVALFLLGADHRFSTRTVLEERGRVPRLVLVGGGDPFLASTPNSVWGTQTPATVDPDKADIVTLARQTARSLTADGVTTVRLGYDDSLFTGPAANPYWEPDYVPDGVVSPITALWLEEGRSPTGGRVGDPSAYAVEVFSGALRRAGIDVTGPLAHVVAEPGATGVSKVQSAPLEQIVQRLIEVSDNEATEVLFRHIGVASEGDGSSAGGQAGVQRVLAANGIDMAGSVLYDGSGLSRQNLMAPSLLLDVIRWASAPRQPDLRAVVSGLPVAAYTGSLADRMSGGDLAGRGRVRAKTGTLTGVTSLAGVAVDLDGNLWVFAMLADRVPPPRSGLGEIAMDNAAAALGACHCGD